MVLTILALLMVPLVFAENPKENADEPEKFRNSLKQLDIRKLSYTVVSVVRSNAETE